MPIGKHINRIAILALRRKAFPVTYFAAASTAIVPLALALILMSPASSVGGTTPTLSPSQAHTIALGLAQSAGDSTPAQIQSVRTTIGAGVKVIGPTSKLPNNNATISQWAIGPAYVEVIHGHFALSQVPRPRNVPPPTGSTLSVVIEAETGQIAFLGLNDSAHGPTSSELENLGKLETSPSGES